MDYKEIKKHFISIICIITSLLVLYNAGIKPMNELLIRSIYLILGTLLILILYPLNPKHKGKPKGVLEILLDILFAAMTIYSFGYIISEYETILNRASAVGLTNWDIVVAGMATIVTMEIARRTTGLGSFIVVCIALLYVLVGFNLPAPITAREYSLERIARMVFYSTYGIFGLPLSVMASTIYIFVVFGSFLEATGAGEIFLKVSKIVMGRIKGGAGQVPVLSSALFGTVSGSAVANVAVDGCFTIPLMKRSGYPGRVAGAIEAVASSGGQLVPPIMGTAAFYIAQITGIPYFMVCISALIPGSLYYLSLAFSVFCEAQKRGLQPIPKEERPKITTALLRASTAIFVPLGVVIAVMAMGATPMKAGLWGVISVVILSVLNPELRNLKWVKVALVGGPKMALPVLATVASVGIFIGVVTTTGLGVALGDLIVTAAGENLLLLLIFTAFAALLLGCGMPTGSTYLIIILVMGHVLISMEIPVIAAHLFVFYFGVISAITPPVAMAAYAAAGISGDNPISTGFAAFKFGVNGFLIPLAFVYNPGICMIGPWHGIVWDTFRVVVGILSTAVVVQGWFFDRVNWPIRLLLLLCAMGIITPTSPVIDTASFIVICVVLFLNYRSARLQSIAKHNLAATSVDG